MAGSQDQRVGGWAAVAGAAKLQLAVLGSVAVAGVVGYTWQTRANDALRRNVVELAGQQRSVALLRRENQVLAAHVAEIEALRHDDAEFKRLAQQVEEARKANEARTRQAAAAQANTQNAQLEIDRLNREGNALVNQYKALVALGNDASQTAEQRATTMAEASRKLAEIQAKQREVQAVIAAARANDAHFPARGAELRNGSSVAGEISFRKASRAQADAASGAPGPSREEARVSFSLPKVDLATALNALEHTTGRPIVRDPSLAAVRGTINFSGEKLTMSEAAQALSAALQKQLNVTLETNADGALVAKSSSR